MKDTVSHLSYKDLPLARCGNVIYYGDPSKDHIIRIDILSYKKVNEIDVPEKCSIRLVNSSAASRDNIFGNLKSSEKYSLYSSLDLGSVWLERSL